QERPIVILSGAKNLASQHTIGTCPTPPKLKVGANHDSPLLSPFTPHNAPAAYPRPPYSVAEVPTPRRLRQPSSSRVTPGRAPDAGPTPSVAHPFRVCSPETWLTHVRRHGLQVQEQGRPKVHPAHALLVVVDVPYALLFHCPKGNRLSAKCPP